MPFRFNAKKIFLTYPQCGALTKQEVSEFLTNIGCTAWVVGAETHGDGGHHVHAYGEWPNKFDTRNERTFDIAGNHPNIQPVRDRNAVIAYCKKENDYIENIGDIGRHGRYADLVATESKEDFWALVKSQYPRDYVLQLDKLNQFCEHKFGTTATAYNPRFTAFRVPDELRGWTESELGNSERPKTLWLVGKSRLGKTEWARSLGCHIYWNGHIDLGTWNEEARYIIFDDFDWNYFPFKKQFVGAQREFVVTDKYRRKKTIKWGKPCIILWNEDNDPWDHLKRAELDWYQANCIRKVISECLFTAENVWVEI